MARSIGTISGDLISSPDIIYTAQALGSTAAITSTAFKFGTSQASVNLKVYAVTEITVAATETITFDLYHCATYGGSYVKLKSMVVLPAATYAIGDELVNFVPGDDVKAWCKIVTTTTADQSADTIKAYVSRISR